MGPAPGTGAWTVDGVRFLGTGRLNVRWVGVQQIREDLCFSDEGLTKALRGKHPPQGAPPTKQMGQLVCGRRKLRTNPESPTRAGIYRFLHP